MSFFHDFMVRTQMPAAASEAYLNCYESVLQDPDTNAILSSILSRYTNDIKCDYHQIIAMAEEIGRKKGYHRYLVCAVVYIAMSEILLRRYDERGLSRELFYHTMRDIVYKTVETMELYGVYGIHCPLWYPYFFRLKRFAFGNLQFEEGSVSGEIQYLLSGHIIHPGDPVLNVHLPKTGQKLDYEGVCQAYHDAATFFSYYFRDQKILFQCRTWLFFEENFTDMDRNSNLFRFYQDYSIVDSGFYENYEETWRVFQVCYDGDVRALPERTALQKKYKQIIREGRKTGWARGLMVYGG